MSLGIRTAPGRRSKMRYICIYASTSRAIGIERLTGRDGERRDDQRLRFVMPIHVIMLGLSRTGSWLTSLSRSFAGPRCSISGSCSCECFTSGGSGKSSYPRQRKQDNTTGITHVSAPLLRKSYFSGFGEESADGDLMYSYA